MYGVPKDYYAVEGVNLEKFETSDIPGYGNCYAVIGSSLRNEKTCGAYLYKTTFEASKLFLKVNILIGGELDFRNIQCDIGTLDKNEDNAVFKLGDKKRAKYIAHLITVLYLIRHQYLFRDILSKKEGPPRNKEILKSAFSVRSLR